MVSSVELDPRSEHEDSPDDLLLRLDLLERQMSRLLSNRSLASAVDGPFSLKFPQRIQGPNGDAYILVREAGGNLALVASANVASGDWSDV